MYGSATFTTVMSSSSMNVATQTATSVHHRAIGRHGTWVDSIRVTTTSPTVPDSLWARLRADPVRAPEHIALAASALHAPAAAEWAAEKRGRLAVSGPELARMAKRRHATMARFEGAATGVGGIFTAVPDAVLLAWIQSRLVFFIAAAYGFDPHDPMRPAELLVLRDLYPDPQTARQALDGIGKTVAEAYVGSQIERGREQAMLSRLLRFVGKRTANRAARRLIPGIAIAFNAIANERDTRALADKAIRFYGG
jgi:EcsC protein family